jgi:AcrR family transcriptional regulator
MRTVNPERYAARRSAILRAAATLFAEHGFDGTTTAAVCRAAGIGSGTLFHYFPDKRSLFHALFADDVAATAKFVGRLDRSDPLAALLALVDHRAADVGDPLVPGLLMAALTQASRDPQFAALLERDDRTVRAAAAELIDDAARRGQVAPTTDAQTAARWVCALGDALYFQAAEDGFDAGRDTAVLRTLVLRFLGAAA